MKKVAMQREIGVKEVVLDSVTGGLDFTHNIAAFDFASVLRYRDLGAIKYW